MMSSRLRTAEDPSRSNQHNGPHMGATPYYYLLTEEKKMDEMIYNLMEEVKVKEELAGENGFMRNTCNRLPNDPITGNTYKACYYVNSTPDEYVFPRGTKESIMQKCTAEEYYILQHVSYASNKKAIKKFVNILQRLLDDGEFDESPVNMPWGVQPAFPTATNTNTTSGETDEKKEDEEEIL
jgi:negative regulator of replication initiation